MALYWMSFYDPEKPKGRQLLGVALVEASSLPEAITRAWQTGCNPGGEISTVEIPMDLIPKERRAALDKAPRDTLMDCDTLEQYGLLDS